MEKLEEDPGISTPLLGKYIVDDIIADNENSFEGASACIGLFNVSTARRLFEAWEKYAYRNEEALLNKNYSRNHKAKGDDTLYLYDEESDTLYYYDEYEDEIYYYDEWDDEWYILE